MSIKDIADNTFDQYNSQSEILKFNVVNQNEDITAPILNSVSITQETVEAGKELTFIVNATDDNTGIYSIKIIIRNPYGDQSEIIAGAVDGSFIVWENIGDNNYSSTIILNENAASGEWYVDYISIKDIADNTFDQYNSQSEILKFNVVNQNEDITAPILNSVSITQETVEAGKELTSIVNATDDNTGIYSIKIIIRNPYGDQSEIIAGAVDGSFIVWENIGDNNYSSTIILNENAASGEWYVDYVSIKDVADNTFDQYNSQSEILKFMVGEIVTGLNHKKMLDSISVLLVENDNYIINSPIEINSVRIYNSIGQCILHDNNEDNIFTINNVHGMLIFVLDTEYGRVSKKVIKK